ncbi:unnamed protein product [Blepharisma stoltei]|uniref:Uncharacterized protein n=1 Tax=Blepharisma stoltei TaxID=1481888 RepID=A0AAU9IX98_9CILI|nr:unnamed protein product [Blepharisma stoltei]
MQNSMSIMIQPFKVQQGAILPAKKFKKKENPFKQFKIWKWLLANLKRKSQAKIKSLSLQLKRKQRKPKSPRVLSQSLQSTWLVKATQILKIYMSS